VIEIRSGARRWWNTDERLTTTSRAPCKGTVFQQVRILPDKLSLQSVAIGAVVEVTKRLKPSM
jgi:hypothetical protein